MAPLIKDILIGNNGRKLVSATVLLIIGFLIHIKNKKPEYEPVREKLQEKGDSKKKKVNLALHREEKATWTQYLSQE